MPDDPNHVYMTEIDRWDRIVSLDLYKVDLTTGVADLITHGTPKTIQFLTDNYGLLIGQVQQDSDLTDHIVMGSRDVYQYDVKGRAAFELEGITAGADPHFVAKKTTPFGTEGLYVWKEEGEIGSALFEDPARDVDDILYNERDGRVIGFVTIDDMPRSHYFDPATQKIQEALEKAYPGQTVSIVSRDKARSKYVIATEGPKNPLVLSLFTVADHQTHVVEEAYPSLKSADLGEMKSYPYKAGDGLEIQAYLTLPPGKQPHNLPVVVFPHGGPEARDMIGFDWWAQFMASRGYAVFQPNFRGSAGYGAAFVKAGDGEWAGKVQDDVQEGVKKLIADGIADPKRICIVGASYGGYMALAGATFSPNLYACAVSYAGLSDLDRLLYTGTSFDSEISSLWKRRIGADIDSRKPTQASPANFVDRVKIPILLIHSDRDTTVPIEQSQMEETALKRAGKTVGFITLEGDDHYLERSDTRIKLLQSIDAFLAAHIGN